MTDKNALELTPHPLPPHMTRVPRVTSSGHMYDDIEYDDALEGKHEQHREEDRSYRREQREKKEREKNEKT